MTGVGRKDGWTKEMDLQILKLRDARVTWKAIAAELGRTVESCCARYRTIVPKGSRQRFVSIRRWSKEDEAVLMRLLDERRKPRQIASFMGKELQAVYSKIQHMRQPGREIHIERLPRVAVPEHCLEDRDRRMRADRDLTAMFFGDPPFSQSALGKKQRAYA